jgi:Malic enzyme, NAD binding domain
MIGHNSGITLAGVINATKLKGTKLRDEKYLFHGAGSAGIGLACSAPRWSVKACRLRTPPDSLDFARARAREVKAVHGISRLERPPKLAKAPPKANQDLARGCEGGSCNTTHSL